ncbi:rod shape-determining protein MreD [Aliiroseovarius marinus]|uniref:rod shape-determining protein MreD n=1 Tax=Aliiroseovarius marinus TaxID=2500159 RepID=UPI003D7C43DA
MIDHLVLVRWLFRLGLVVLTLILIFVQILPLDLTPGRFPGPDLMLAIVMALVLRRPDYAPAALIVALFFLMDMLFQRVPAVWTLAVLTGTEFLRNREHSMREQPFWIEWAYVAGVLAVMELGRRLLLTVFFVEQVPLGRELLAVLMTALIYPLVVFVVEFVLGIDKMQPGEDARTRQAS